MNQGFEEFKNKLNEFFEGEYPEELCVEVLFDIIEGNAPYYEFDFEHLRLTQDLLLSAILLSEWKNLNVVFLTATSYYSAQAIRMVRRYQQKDVGCKTLSIGVLGLISKNILEEAHVLIHHGRLYDIPKDLDMTKKRSIVQIFKGENVPCDTRSLSFLIHSSYYDD